MDITEPLATIALGVTAIGGIGAAYAAMAILKKVWAKIS